MEAGVIRTVRSEWAGAVLVCGKCSKKLGGGFGGKGRMSLAKVLRKRWGKGRKATRGVVETRCLGVCPKNAVIVIDGAAPERWMLVRAGDDVDAVAAILETA